MPRLVRFANWVWSRVDTGPSLTMSEREWLRVLGHEDVVERLDARRREKLALRSRRQT